MITMISFICFMLPIVGGCAYGITRSIKTIGRTATLMLGISLPFYAVTLKALVEELVQRLQNTTNQTYAGGWNISAFELISIICFLILLTLSTLFSWRYIKKHAVNK